MLHVDALVVAVHPSGDATLVVDLLTRDHGRLGAVARAARKSRQRFPGGLDVLCRVEANLEPPTRGDLHQLQGAVVKESYSALRTDVLALGRAAYVAELAAMVSSKGHPTPGLYAVVLAALDALQAGPVGPALLRWVEVQLLLLLGDLSPPGHCASCGTPLTQGALVLGAHAGHLFCDRCAPPGARPMPAPVAALLRDTVGWTAQQASAAQVSGATSVEAGRFLQAVVDPLLTRTLKSRRFLAQLLRQG